MMQMQFEPLTSSMVTGFHYDHADGFLSLRFRDGNVYAYPGVDSELIDQLRQVESVAAMSKSIGSSVKRTPATSIGRFVHTHILPVFTFKHIAHQVELRPFANSNIVTQAAWGKGKLYLLFRQTGLLYMYENVDKAQWEALHTFATTTEVEQALRKIMTYHAAVKIGLPQMSAQQDDLARANWMSLL